MFQKIASYFSAIAMSLLVAACAVPGSQQGEVEVRSGVIEQITPVQIESTHQAGVGAVVGGRVFSMPHASKAGVVGVVLVFVAIIAYLVLPGIVRAMTGSGCV